VPVVEKIKQDVYDANEAAVSMSDDGMDERVS
jgi:hypothetical protein